MERDGFDDAQKIRVYGGKVPRHTRLTSARAIPRDLACPEKVAAPRSRVGRRADRIK